MNLLENFNTTLKPQSLKLRDQFNQLYKECTKLKKSIAPQRCKIDGIEYEARVVESGLYHLTLDINLYKIKPDGSPSANQTKFDNKEEKLLTAEWL